LDGRKILEISQEVDDLSNMACGGKAGLLAAPG
jgi:hypothetical protein